MCCWLQLSAQASDESSITELNKKVLLLNYEASRIKGNYENSLQAVDQLLQLKNRQAEQAAFHKLKGNTQVQLQSYGLAIKEFQQANAFKKGTCDYEIAQCYMLLGNESLAMQHLKQHLESPYQKEKSFILKDTLFYTLHSKTAWKDLWSKNWYNKTDDLIGELKYLYKYKIRHKIFDCS